MKTVCAIGTTTRGFDVSNYQPSINMGLQKASGMQFCFIKASEGLSLDLTFKSHWANAKAAGLLRGAYHFFHPQDDALDQANYFSGIVGKLGEGDLPCVIDWEATDGVPSGKDRLACANFLVQVTDLTGKTPIIYGSPYFLEALSLDPSFSRYQLWIAHTGVDCPLVPSPWDLWSFWQFSTNTLDLNVFNGPLSQLQKFAL